MTGGSREYVRKLAELFGDRLRLNCGATAITRHEDYVTIRDSQGGIEKFDHVVMAAHAPDSLKALADADEKERAILSACRYARLKDKPLYEPQGIRGDGPMQACRYWGISQQEYYEVADVWPLAPKGELFIILQIEDTQGIENLDDILKNVPGIGAILIGEGDLSQELGYPRQTEHPVVLDAMAKVVDTCKRHNVIVGHPHVSGANAERVISEGYRFLMCSAPRSFNTLEKSRALVGR